MLYLEEKPLADVSILPNSPRSVKEEWRSGGDDSGLEEGGMGAELGRSGQGSAEEASTISCHSSSALQLYMELLRLMPVNELMQI